MSSSGDAPFNPDPRIQRAMELILAVCNERINPAEVKELEDLVRQDVEVRRLYVRMMHLHASLYQYGAALGEGSAPPASDEPGLGEEQKKITLNESMVLPALSGETLELDRPEEAPLRLPPLPPPRRDEVPSGAASTKLFRYGLPIAAALAACVTLAVLLHNNSVPEQTATNTQPRPPKPVTSRPTPQLPLPPPPSPAVARIAETIDASWEPGAGPPEDGKLPAGSTLRLRSGCVQIDWVAGGQTIVEGPVTLQIESGREVFLRQGSVASDVPGGGFVVKTPNGVLTDLGTRFGVAVKVDGTTQVDVFEGAVQAAIKASSGSAPPVTGPATAEAAKPLTLSAGKAAVLSTGTVTIDRAGAMPQRFITHLSRGVTHLNVVDLICGGDGTTHRHGNAIDAPTGRYGELQPVGARTPDEHFHMVTAVPVIDSVFVPNGARGPMHIDSADNQFAFPATAGTSVNRIWTGGEIPWFHEPRISTQVAGVDYAQAPHAILCVHSNNGLTFNLANIRRLYPGRSLARFRCSVANSYVNGTIGETGVNPRADVFVIVDGKERMARRRFTNQDGMFNVDVPLTAADRFMSLATTDGGDGINDDWVLWLDPQIDLAP